MAGHMDVVGYDVDGEPITEGEVMGEIMGDLDGDELVGVARKRAIRALGSKAGTRMMKLPPKPNWRTQLAPGVIQPDEGMLPLPLQPMGGVPLGTFTVGGATMITWQGQLQKPFRGERLLAAVDKKAGATERLLAKIWVGTDLQAAEIAGIDLELLADPGAFGTRLTMKAAEPGVMMRIEVTPSAALTGSETIFATITILGRVIH